MPTYDYRCETCDHTFEFYQSFFGRSVNDMPSETCGNEGGGTVKKIFSARVFLSREQGFTRTITDQNLHHLQTQSRQTLRLRVQIVPVLIRKQNPQVRTQQNQHLPQIMKYPAESKVAAIMPTAIL